MADILKKQNGIGDLYVREPKKEWNKETETVMEVVELWANDKLALEYESRNHGTLTRTYTINSVVSYALQYNECPIAAVERAKGFGHELVFIFGNGACIHNGPRSTAKHIYVEIGMTVKFQGHYYTIEKAPNDNLKLKEI